MEYYLQGWNQDFVPQKKIKKEINVKRCFGKKNWKIRKPLAEVENLVDEQSNLDQLKQKIKRIEIDNQDRWDPCSLQTRKNHSSFIQTKQIQKIQKRPMSCRQVRPMNSSYLREIINNKVTNTLNYFQKEDNAIKIKLKSIHSRKKWKSLSLKPKTSLTINQLQKGKAEHFIKCLKSGRI